MSKNSPLISKIRVYPIKSLDPVELQEVKVGVHSLSHDRTFAMVTADNRYINGKMTGRVNQLKAEYDLPNRLITLSERNSEKKQTFTLDIQNKDLVHYLADFFETNMSLVRSNSGQLMDIPKASSVTIVSEGSLGSIQNDLPDHTLEDLRLRFRSNLEVSGVTPFWEEQLFSEPGTGIHFLIGDIEFIGVSPRARCNVPPKHPLTGEMDKLFAKKMIESRSNSLPSNSLLPKHGNFYHLAVNSYLHESQKGKTIKIGDRIKVLGPVKLR